MVFNEGEAQRLIEILSEKAGVIQDTWHKVGPTLPAFPLGPVSCSTYVVLGPQSPLSDPIGLAMNSLPSHTEFI